MFVEGANGPADPEAGPDALARRQAIAGPAPQRAKAHLRARAKSRRTPERIARVSEDAYARAGVDQGAADSAVAGLVRALAAIELGRPSRAGPAARPLRQRDPDRRADRDRPLDRRGRDQAPARRAARPLRHGRDRLRGDERQRRDLRRRRAAGDARLHRDRARRPRGLRADRRRPRPRRGAGGDRDPGRRAGPARRHGQGRRPRRRLLRHGRAGRGGRRVGGRARRSGDRPALLGHPLQRLHAGALGARGLPLDEDPEGRLGAAAGRGAAGADRDLRQAGARAAALVSSRSAGSRTSPPAASAICSASPPRSATRSTTRCRCRRSSS